MSSFALRQKSLPSFFKTNLFQGLGYRLKKRGETATDRLYESLLELMCILLISSRGDLADVWDQADPMPLFLPDRKPASERQGRPSSDLYSYKSKPC